MTSFIATSVPAATRSMLTLSCDSPLIVMSSGAASASRGRAVRRRIHACFFITIFLKSTQREIERDETDLVPVRFVERHELPLPQRLNGGLVELRVTGGPADHDVRFHGARAIDGKFKDDGGLDALRLRPGRIFRRHLTD